eukprot:CAMPEP_0185198070 /NCGR_PEP_ID=MMETSP1140-20130426/42006_1 /TAXON_ID=298111 /ORGANISM="Pavlova sp., Strain CCMP459" /LENGTH=71 /DNA_ID=CAMNT_0027765241 /DNA_START=87 /DNA_END=300 /DNA_ORIENTATION=+
MTARLMLMLPQIDDEIIATAALLAMSHRGDRLAMTPVAVPVVPSSGAHVVHAGNPGHGQGGNERAHARERD